MNNRKSVPILVPFLILVSAIFIGIMIFTYVETKKANPQMIRVGRAVGRIPRSARVPLDPLPAGPPHTCS